MKKIILIFILIPIIGFSQNSNKYKEFNAGIFVNNLEFEGWSRIDLDFIFPGASFLWGKTNYYDNFFFFDYQVGVAFPSLVTGKAGIGLGSQDSPLIFSTGIRPWPPTYYVQLDFNRKFIISLEPFLSEDMNGTGIATVGFRF
tara:strand:- start:44 stop:472 length:429 start_codon:yes stop_codon:yes gene_type:complete